MFFLVRSAFCIGIVFCMLPDAGGQKALQDLAADTGRLAVSRAETYCADHAPCARTGFELATAVLARPNAPADQADRRRAPIASSASPDPAAHPAKTKAQARG